LIGGVSLSPWRTVALLAVRAILGISCLLLGVALLLCQGEGAGVTADIAPRSAVSWVRTADGWERPDTWLSVTAWRPALHPLVVAAGQGLLSVFGLVLFHRGET
jgi:hypothetical protein